MHLITDTTSLAAFCDRLTREDFVTIDTEFLRERTYWPQLCLVQLAGEDRAAAIDALHPDLDLSPLWELLQNRAMLKVVHAGRQDIEIFFHHTGRIPTPLFDTQIAAMVCGFGDQVGYETLVRKLAKAQIDKSSRFTDWSLRPLTEKQLAYALSDVTHLRAIYRKLRARIESTGRLGWIEEEMAILADPDTYQVHPAQAWRRLKVRSSRPHFLAILRELAAWREETAQTKDLPRNRVVRDEALLEIAAHAPADVAALARTRGLPRAVAEGKFGQAIMAAVARGQATPEVDCPTLPPARELPRGLGPVVDLLRVLLKMKCDANEVAQKLVASAADLEQIAADDDADVPALRGWRRELFGEDALALKHGRLALTVSGRKLRAVPSAVPEVEAPATRAARRQSG
jgi:ribonuclease D